MGNLTASREFEAARPCASCEARQRGFASTKGFAQTYKRLASGSYLTHSFCLLYLHSCNKVNVCEYGKRKNDRLAQNAPICDHIE